MARKTRAYVEGMPHYILLTGNNGERCFFDKFCFEFYLDRLATAARLYETSLHAYVLLHTEVLILATPKRKDSLSGMMKALNTSYAYVLNTRYGRTGTVWRGRYKAAVVQPENYLLECHRYMEIAPVARGLVEHPGQYPWSSYIQNAIGGMRLLSPHAEYLKLGKDLKERCRNYRNYIATSSSVSEQVAYLINTNRPMMNDKFKREIETCFGVTLTVRDSCGRPRRSDQGTITR